MFKFNSILSRSLLALALAAGSAAAIAGPTYHVDINTSSQAGTNGGLLLSFLGLDNSDAVATIDHWSGSFLGDGMAINDALVNYDAGSLRIASGYNAYVFDVAFGGNFGFDVTFDLDAGPVGSTFGVALTDDMYDYITDDIVSIAFQQDQPVSVTANATYASVTPAAVDADVPEPADWALVMSGLGLMGFALRRRVR